eukprot:4125122-Pyramimonas_sp.AAC.2
MLRITYPQEEPSKLVVFNDPSFEREHGHKLLKLLDTVVANINDLFPLVERMEDLARWLAHFQVKEGTIVPCVKTVHVSSAATAG